MQHKYPPNTNRRTASAIHAACWLTALGTVLALTASPGYAQEAATNHYQIMLKYDFGTNAVSFTALEDEARQAKPEERAAIEKKLIGILESPDATFPARQYACRLLNIAGSPACVPVLEKLLADEQLSHAARIPLQAIQDKSAGKALLKALSKTKGKLKIGIINSIGVRADSSAVGDLADLLNDKDEAMIQAALNSLGRIGTAKAAKALGKARVPDSLKARLCEAKATCANRLCSNGEEKLAGEIFTGLMIAGNPDSVRAAGFVGLTRVKKDKAVPFVIETLKSGDAVLARAACPALMALQGDGINRKIAAELAGLPAAGKVAALNALAGRKDATAIASAVNPLINDQSAEVRLAATRAAAKLGDASSVSVLAQALKSDDDISRAAVQSLRDLQGNGVVDELMKAAGTGEPAVRAGVLTVLGERSETGALPVMYKSAEDQDSNVRAAAIKGLGLLVGQQDLPKLVDILIAQKDGGERNKLEQAIAAAAQRIGNADERSAATIQGLAKADDPAKCNLLGALSKMGGGKAIEAVKSLLASSNADVKKAAVRSLSDWVDAAPMNDVLELAKTSTEESHKILALRGYIRMAGLDRGKPAKDRIAWYKQALELASRPDEKRAALGGLDEVGHLDALKLVEGYLNDEKVKNEALSAYAKIADKIGNGHKEEARAALRKVIESTKDQGLINRAKESLEKIAK